MMPGTGGMTRVGTFANGMAYLTWGSGPKSLLYIQGGPGSDVPGRIMLRMFKRQFAPLVDAGFAVWVVTRRRHMPSGHTFADMADDYAQVISEEFGGHVDLVLGISLGGLIAQHLAASHPDRFDHIAIVAAACRVSDWGKDVDGRLAEALAAGDRTRAGMAFAEYLLPAGSMRSLRRMLAPILGRLLAGYDIPPEDLLTEAQAERTFDARPILPNTRVPVLLICGDQDRCFPQDLVRETDTLIPDCMLVRYPGRGHAGTATKKRMAHDVLRWVIQTPVRTRTPDR